MKFGVQHGMGDPGWKPPILEPENVKRFVKLAEDAGYDSIAFTDHPAPSVRWVESGGEGVADAISALSFCAAVSDRIRLLTWVMVPPFRNPFTAAHAIATMDRLSGGRVTLGFGTGYLRSEFFAAGANPKVKLRDFEETVAIMKRVWAGEDVTYEGMGFSAREVRAVPSAVQDPHPPIWVHGNSDWGVEYCAEHADGWIGMITTERQVKTIRTRAIPDLDALALRIDDYRAACARHGREPGTIAMSGMCSMLDIRSGYDAGAMLSATEQLANMGVDYVVVNVCGDDVQASEDTTSQFSQDVMSQFL
jgi:probable F420-dependent oxidoreductase